MTFSELFRYYQISKTPPVFQRFIEAETSWSDT